MDFGFCAYRICKKPQVSAKNMKDLLQFCRTYADLTEEQLSKIFFTQETLIKQFQCSDSVEASDERYTHVTPSLLYNIAYQKWFVAEYHRVVVALSRFVAPFDSYWSCEPVNSSRETRHMVSS